LLRPLTPATDTRSVERLTDQQNSSASATSSPHAEENVAKLIAAWRRRGDPIVVVQHDWQGGPLERGTPGFELKEGVAGQPALQAPK
jgi:nicotinamidase-related amidase